MKKTLIGMLAVACVAVSVWASGEITATAYLKAAKGGMKLEKSPGTIVIDMAGSRYNSKIYALTTNAWQSLDVGACVTNGIVWLRDGLQGSVKVSFDAGVTTSLLVKTNEFYFFRLDPARSATNVHFMAVQPSTNVIAAYDFEATILED